MKPNLRIPIRQYARLLSGYLRPYRANVLRLAVLLAFSIAAQLVNPQIIRYFIDSAEQQKHTVDLLWAAGCFIGVTILQQAASVIASYMGENIGWLATNKLRADVAEHCLKLDLTFHKAHTAGSLIERVDGDINLLANFFAKFAILLLSNVLLMIGILVLLFREGWQIGLSMSLFALFAIFLIQRIRKFAAPLWGRMRQISADFFGFLGEHLEGTEDTRANGATGYVLHRFFGILREWLPIRVKAFAGFAAMWISTIVDFGIGNAVAFAVSAWLWKGGAITIGTVYMIFYYTELMNQPIESIRTQMEDLQRADASIVRIRQLLATPSQIVDGAGAPIPAGPLSVRFERVVFGYEDGLTTLAGVDFELGAGQVLGILGRTGSGKSTMAKLLMRFHDPRSGAVRLGGVNVRDARVEDLRRRIGFVTQTIELVRGTVRDNLTFYDPEVTDERIREVLQELGMGDWLSSLPEGLDTMLESGGGGLSAGEAQLLSFARVFLINPGLLILDEASSRLDPATERRLERAVTKLLEGRTCIIIAHRLATIGRADKILMLENGRVVEFGDRSALAADPTSRFSQVLKTGMEEMLA